MARPREFDEDRVLDGAVRCFWRHGYEATSIRDLIGATGIAAASLYNAYGDKRALFEAALDHYVEGSIGDRIRRCETLPPREAIRAFFDEIVHRSLADGERKGCMLVNAALEISPDDPAFRALVVRGLSRIEGFFLHCIEAGQANATIPAATPARDLAQHLLGVLMGMRVLARMRPERELLEAVARPALALLDAAGNLPANKR